MHSRVLRSFAVSLILIFASASVFGRTAKALQIYAIDVEGGQATLIVSPAGQSLLIDTGWPGFNGRDADRIVAAAHVARLKRIDYVLITHHHRDHVGGVPQLVERVKVGTFVDHGPNLEDSDVTREDYAAYQKAIAGHPHIVGKPGMGLPLKGLEVHFLSAAGDLLQTPLPGAGTANPYCASEPAAEDDPTENARSLGLMIRYGNFRFLDLGDLTKKKEAGLVCPNNLIGTADLFLVSHHGADLSNSKALVWALHPRVAIFDNGPHKGGSREAWQTVHDSPGIEDVWQLHYAMDSDKDHNVAADRIANPAENCEGKYIKVEASPDGTFTVINSRTGLKQTYEKK
ncbi:MAG: MBL fold metallo-hydrolase [Candidatus Sulfotelmatobacter sp.]